MQNLEKQFDKLFGCVINIQSQEQLNNKIKLWVNDHYTPKESAPLDLLVSDDFGGQKQLWLDNLLCTIHRDGGHFITDYGYVKAYDKAIEKIVNWIQRDDSQNSR